MAPGVAGSLRTSLAGDEARLIVDGITDAELAMLAARENAQLRIEPMSLEDLFVELA
jgi:hypothetical protein